MVEPVVVEQNCAEPHVPDTRLELVDLVKSYGPVQALRGVSLSASSGEVVGLIGDNGAGKSTLVKCLSGIVKPDTGQVVLNGQPVTVDSPKTARRLGIETVHQDLALIDTLDVTANLFLNRETVTGRGPLGMFGWPTSGAGSSGVLRSACARSTCSSTTCTTSSG